MYGRAFGGGSGNDFRPRSNYATPDMRGPVQHNPAMQPMPLQNGQQFSPWQHRQQPFLPPQASPQALQQQQQPLLPPQAQQSATLSPQASPQALQALQMQLGGGPQQPQQPPSPIQALMRQQQQLAPPQQSGGAPANDAIARALMQRAG